MIGSVSIGRKEIWIATYNPSDELAKLYATFVLGRMVELLDQTTEKEVHTWLRKHFPEVGNYLARIEAGEHPVRTTPVGEYPMSPIDGAHEKKIINFLQMRKRGLV